MPNQNDLNIASMVAANLGIPLDWLMTTINFETAGTFDPQISNPKSSAKGLIQFIDSTAQGLGYRDSQDLVDQNPTFAGQLQGPVYQYFKKYMPFPTQQSFAMTVFRPASRNVPPDTLFPASVQAVNPGIDTVQSYIDKANAQYQKKKFWWKPSP
jgi:hypothetical protein